MLAFSISLLKIKWNVFIVKVNCSSSVFDDNQTHLNIEEDENSEQIVVKVSEDLFTFCKSMTS